MLENPKNKNEIVSGLTQLFRQNPTIKKWVVADVRENEVGLAPRTLRPLLSKDADVLMIAIQVPRRKKV